MKYLLIFLIHPLFVNGQKFTDKEILRWKDQSTQVTIIRDGWGIPHVYGKTDADAVFGLLYAQCEDDFARVEMNYITALGRVAEVKGEAFLYNDLRSRMYADTIRAISIYEESPPWLKKLMQAFADGANYYLYTHTQAKPKLLHRFQPWLPLLFSEGSIGGDLNRISIGELKKFYAQDPALVESLGEVQEPRGSNGFAISPSRSKSGNALLLINPHTSFYFRSEVHMVSEEGLNAYGAVTWGQFFVYQGFNSHCGWMHTSTYADAVDEYIETVARRGDSVFYKHDGKWKPVRSKTVLLSYNNEDRKGGKQFTIYETHHGPVIADRDGKWVTIRMMDEPLAALIQSYMRTKSTGYKSYKKWLKLKANSSNNTVFADNRGNIAYWHGNFMPKRNPQFNWNRAVDGSDPATDWQSLHSTGEIISLLNPPNGWIQNCNSTPFTAAGDNSPQRKNYPAYMAPDGQNYRAVNAERVLTRASDFTLDKLIEAAYDPTLAAFEKLIPDLARVHAALGDGSELKEKTTDPVKLVISWDMKSNAASIATTLAILWGRKLQEIAQARIAPDVLMERRSDLLFVIGFIIGNLSDQEKSNAFGEVVDELQKDFGTWKVPWGDVNRFQRLTGNIDEIFDDLKPSTPVSFAPAFWGSLAAFSSRPYPGTKKLYGYVGNSFVAVVEFGKRIKAKSVVTGGSASDPNSPHFNDQAMMYCRGGFKDVFYYKDDVLKNSRRTYHPGE